MLQLAADKGIKSWVERVPVGEKGVGEAREYFLPRYFTCVLQQDVTNRTKS
jgi:hypothetical protein